MNILDYKPIPHSGFDLHYNFFKEELLAFENLSISFIPDRPYNTKSNNISVMATPLTRKYTSCDIEGFKTG